MLPKQNPTQTTSWSHLTQLAKDARSLKISNLFHENPKRFTQFSIEKEGFLLDYSNFLFSFDIIC